MSDFTPTPSVQDFTTIVLRAIAALAVCTLALAPWWASRAELRLLMEALSFLALAQMWNLLAGFSGLLSVGQQAYVGLGGYFFFALTMLAGVSIWWALPFAALGAAALAVPAAWIAFRLQGAYFAIGTWVIAEVFRLIAAQIGIMGGGSGISLPVSVAKSLSDSRAGRDLVMYYMAFGIGISSVLLVWAILRSRWGLALSALRDSETAAETVGISIRRLKFVIYVGVAMMTGLTGAFIFLQKLRITPDAAFSVTDWTAFVIFIVVIGGLGSIEGPIVGVIVFFTLREFASDWGTWYLMLMGGLAIAVMLINKRGLWGGMQSWKPLEVFPVRKYLKDTEVSRRNGGTP